MTPERWRQARLLFDAAIDRSPAAADDHWLRDQCAGDGELFSCVRRMVEEHRLLEQAGGASTLTTTLRPGVFEPGQLVGGRYRIVRYISCGGMGEVYEAEHPLLPDRVALKTLLPLIASDDAMIARFKQEIQLARRVAHPNVCKVFDLEWHDADGSPRVYFLTMELLAGETLTERIRTEGRIAPAAALPLFEQMADALSAAHRQGIVHRDFKTSNVILVPTKDAVRAVVTDFGLARGVSTGEDSTATLTNHVAGTLDYMAPELLLGGTATFQSDIYALGMVAYKMLTGELPFAGEAPLAAALLRMKQPVPSPGLDQKWDGAILRALDRDPARRFADVAEMARVVRGEVPALKAPASRRKAPVAALVAVLIGVGGTGWWGWSHTRTQLTAEAAHLYRQGVDNLHAGAYFAATQALEQAVHLAPRYSPARARLAEAWLELDFPEKAAREFLPVRREENGSLPKLDRLQIEAVDLTLTREYAAAVGKYKEMRALAGDTLADLDVDLGRAYEKALQSDLAIEAYRRAANGPWHSAAAWVRLGALYGFRKKLPEAEAAFAEANRRYLQTSNLEGLTELTLQRGVAANRNNRYDEAAVLLRKAIERAHETGNLQQEISASLTLANVSYASGNGELARTLASESLAQAQANQMESLTIRGFINLGNTYRAKFDFAGAEKQFQEALKLALRTGSLRLAAQSRMNLAALYDQSNRSDEQVREAKAALGYYEPNHWLRETFQGLALVGRGELHRGNDAAARVSFERLLKESTTAGDRVNIALAEESLGDLFTNAEDYPRALEHYRGFQAASGAAQAAYAARDCGIALLSLGRFEEANAEFERASATADLKLSLARSRADMALAGNHNREALDQAQAALSTGGKLSPLSADLTRIVGLALARSGDRKNGLLKCEEAFAAALRLNDAGEIFDARLSLLEAFILNKDFARAKRVFSDLEPALSTHPESRWRGYALMAIADPLYAGRSKEAVGQLEAFWGRDAFRQYLTRSDAADLSRPLLPPSLAKR